MDTYSGLQKRIEFTVNKTIKSEKMVFLIKRRYRRVKGFFGGLFFLFVILINSPGANASEGRELYLRHCSGCHHSERIGYYGPPLLPPFLKSLSDKDLERIIRHGIPQAPLKPSFPMLGSEETKAIIAYLREEPHSVNWTEEDINKSLQVFELKKEYPGLKDIKNLTVVVERGRDSIWVMEGAELLDKAQFSNIHGGIKFTYGGDFFVPSKDGWIGRYNLKKRGFSLKVRPCIYMRNISLSRDEEYLIASCGLPSSIVILSPETLRPIKVLQLDGKINAIYELSTRDEAIFTLRDRPVIGLLDTKKDFNLRYLSIDEPLDSFFIDPFEEYVIGSSRGGKRLAVYSLKDGSKVFDVPIEGMPHLFSASWWYNKGFFYFATPHTKAPYITVWRMYEWAFIKKIDIGGEGFLIRTNSATPYLWLDNGSDELVLIDKRELSIKKLIPVKGKKVTHTEVSHDGRLAYVSIYDKDGYLLLYDGVTLKEIKRYEARLLGGKYNYVNKSRRYNLFQLGREVFMEKCWGCHHPEREAFGPSFQWIVNRRDESLVKAYLMEPERYYSALGYKRSVMPRIGLNEREVKALISFVKEYPYAQDD